MDLQALTAILARLQQIETEHKVSIIYAVESGSRAWGFESIDSDYDVRFIYMHEPSWYWNILPKREVIDYPIIDLYDYSGWDLRKALFLMNKSNPVLLEWLNSPIVYRKKEISYNLLKEAADLYFSPISSIYHYHHMASGNYRKYLQEEMVKVKKYFYVLRPIFACMWIESYKNNPPIVFETLVNKLNLEKNLVESILDLLNRKRTDIELGLEPKIPVISDFINTMLSYFENYTISFNPRVKPSSEYLDKTFVTILQEGG